MVGKKERKCILLISYIVVDIWRNLRICLLIYLFIYLFIQASSADLSILLSVFLLSLIEVDCMVSKSDVS